MAGKRGGIEAGRAFVKAYLDDSLVTRGLKNMRSNLNSFAGSLQSLGGKLLGGGTGLMALFAAPLRRASQIEMLEADLSVLVGSVDTARKVLADFRKFAAETPLEFIDVADLGKQLLIWKLATEDTVVETLRMIGDAAGGIPDRMSGVIIALGQMQAKGKLQSQEFMQLTERGIPAWEMLAKILGTDVASAMDQVSSGSVVAADVVPKLIRAMGEFGQGRMAKMAKTLIGRMSALRDALWEAVTPIGEALLPYAGRLASLAEELVGTIGKWIKANAGLAVRGAAAAVAMITLGSAMIVASVAIRGVTMAVGALGMLLRGVLFPITVALTAAIRVLQGTVNLFTGAIVAARASVLAVAGTLHGLGLIAGMVSSALTAASIVMTLLRRSATLTAAALAAAGAVTYAFRAAIFASQAAVGALAGSLRLLTASLAVVSVALGLLAHPAVAIVAAIGAIGAGIYYAIKQGATFGSVIDWLREKFGPLAQTVMDVFKVITDALMVGEMTAAVKVLWASIQLAFAKGSEFIRGIWIDLTSALASAFIDLAASVESVWAGLAASIKSMMASAGATALQFAAEAARKLGMTNRAMELEMLASGLSVAGIAAGVEGGSEQSDIEKRRKEIQATIAEDAERQKKALEGSSDDEAKGLADAMQAAQTATKEAEAKMQELPATLPLTDDAAAPDVPKKATDALNTAAIVGTQEAAEAFAKATQGVRQITPGEKMLGDKLDVIAEGIDGLVDKAVVIMEGNVA